MFHSVKESSGTNTTGYTMIGLTFSARQFPQNPAEWLHEIDEAYRDARETIPFMPLVGVRPSESELFHLAPRVAVKFRGLPLSRIDTATEAALSSYVASQDLAGNAFDDPYLVFAFLLPCQPLWPGPYKRRVHSRSDGLS